MFTITELYKTAFPPKPTFLPADYPDLEGKTVAITGTTNGMGLATTKLLLDKNAKVITFNRDSPNLHKAVSGLRAAYRDKIDFDSKFGSVVIDLGDLTSFKNVDANLKRLSVSKFDIVILNAGVMKPPNGSVTKQGYELQMGTNCLGHHALMKELDKYVLAASKTNESNPRVIWLSSNGHSMSDMDGGISYEEKEYKHVADNHDIKYYGRSKAGNLYQAAYYAQLRKDDGVISLAVHPGLIRTNLAQYFSAFDRYVVSWFVWPTEYGAYTELFAALSPDVTLDQSGEYIGPFGNFYHRVRPDIAAGRTNGNAKKFWNWCDTQVAQYL